MDPINNIGQIAEIIRRRMAEQTTARPGSASAPETRTGALGGAPQNHLALRSKVAQRVAALDPDDPRKREKAVRMFLESVLLTEFGDAVINDPAFYKVVQEVQMAMESDANVRLKLDALVHSLVTAS